MEAAKIMIDAGTGIVRTVPAPQRWQIDRLRRTARGLGVPWPAGAKWSDVVRSLDRADPDAAAFLTQAAHLLRGAGYAKLDKAHALRGADSRGNRRAVRARHRALAAPRRPLRQ